MRLTLDALEIATLVRGVIANVGLLLLVDLARVDDFFDGALRDEAEYFDVAALADSEGAVLGLEVVRWIPVWVKEDSTELDEMRWGGSYTLFAETMLRPTPPALVEIRKTNICGSLLNWSTTLVPTVRLVLHGKYVHRGPSSRLVLHISSFCTS